MSIGGQKVVVVGGAAEIGLAVAKAAAAAGAWVVVASRQQRSVDRAVAELGTCAQRHLVADGFPRSGQHA